jgi:hypothetical protein
MKGNKPSKAPKLSVPGAKAPAMKAPKSAKPTNFNKFQPGKKPAGGGTPPAY